MQATSPLLQDLGGEMFWETLSVVHVFAAHVATNPLFYAKWSAPAPDPPDVYRKHCLLTSPLSRTDAMIYGKLPPLQPPVP
jgi:hypothetical protein